MTRNIRNILFLLFVFCAQALVAQEISVASFRLLENDLTANTHGTTERDYNGEVSALIKVVTPEKGFVFDGGMVGIVKTKQMTGEVWVYVPHGIKKISIMHDNLGVLRDYYFPISIEKARTYEMKLTTGRVVTTVERKADKQYVMFSVSPANAIVELDGMPLDVDSEGYAEKSMPHGTYDYRVSCANYHTEAGKLTVSSEGRVEKTISLRPNFGWIKFEGDEGSLGADVYIDGERVGKLPFMTKEMKSGTYSVKVAKNMYKSYEEQVIVKDNETLTLNVQLKPNFGCLDLVGTEESHGADVYIDGERVGQMPFMIKEMKSGTYSVKVTKNMYKDFEEQVTVEDGETLMLNVRLKPNFGAIDFVGTEDSYGAHVYINNERVGQLPFTTGKLSSGTYRVKVLKPLYKPFEQRVTVSDNITTTVNVALVPNFANITLITDAESEIWIDGRQCGKGMCTLCLELGEYTVEVKRPSHRTISDVITVSEIIDRTIQLPSPTPVYGILDISSSPSRAIVFLDGVEKGNTPLILEKVLVGSHKVTIKKEGYEPYEKTLTLEENKDNTLLATLEVERPSFANGTKKTYTVNGVSFTMIAVEGGTFTMGATSEQQDDYGIYGGKPTHRVTLSNYTIGETEVTQELWQAVMGRNPSSFEGDLQRPVEWVSWDDCQMFIERLTQLTGEYFRLPTEAEWEYAARGGNISRRYKYSGSNTIDDVAWYDSNSSRETHAVKTKQPNELGIYDMSGNVKEWCFDWYDSYSSSAQTDPKGPSSGYRRVLRGGTHSHWSEKSCCVSAREEKDPKEKSQFIGFRLALQPMTENVISNKKSVDTYTVNGVSFTMIAVEGGTFIMGATSEQGDDVWDEEKPAHEVTLSTYSIGETEVSQELWRAVMGSKSCSDYAGGIYPVEWVSWNDCQKFIKKLNKLTGKNFRLPTEAEWEYAARGGNASKGYKYSGSNDINEVGWYDKSAHRHNDIHLVKTKRPNELGIYDMSGNVKEWCSDKYGSYPSSSQTNPTGPSSGSKRVLRGGASGSHEKACRVSARSYNSPGEQGSRYGLRLAL